MVTIFDILVHVTCTFVSDNKRLVSFKNIYYDYFYIVFCTFPALDCLIICEIADY